MKTSRDQDVPKAAPTRAGLFGALQTAADEQALDKLVEAQSEFLSHSFDKAQAYTQFILSIGYVGLFAAWAFTKDYLSPSQALWSALLATVSLIFFVLYEVAKAAYLSWSIVSVTRTVNDRSQFLARLEQHQKTSARLSVANAIMWGVAFMSSVLTGVSAAGVLIWAFISGLLAAHVAG